MQTTRKKSSLSSARIPYEVKALIAALQMRDPNTCSLKALTEQEWTSLLEFCELAHLTLPLAQVRTHGFPGWVIDRLETNAAYNALRFERVKSTYNEASKALKAANVDFVILKGFTQSPEYVRNPRLRAQSDLDLFCPAASIERARTALETIGYRSDQVSNYSRADHLPTLVRPGDWHWRGNPFDPEMPLSIELHFCLWNESVSLFSIPEVEQFWNRRVTRVFDGLSFPCLNAVDQLGYISLHILRNVIARDWVLHHVRELAVFLHSHASDDPFWKAWSETHDARLRAFEAFAFFYAHSWFGCDLHPVVSEELARMPELRKSWLKSFAHSPVELMFQVNNDSFWLHLNLTDSWRKKLLLLRRYFFPIHFSSINSLGSKIQNRRSIAPEISHPYLRYLRYLASKCAFYTYSNSVTILRFLQWRRSYLSFTRQFWIFLTASFFLT